ncbi:hypothetical protein [Hymenobacter cavernae]|uniref:ApeI dehydratase-like domain-containing protein n=1 Tax=Hymenobacter cavernae TaxID=2044852 RepID=A0ABQ1TWP3_9BACT|nr:hypothetical protein [Hymenobacter cavernae]GGF03853.1 hypothetical protein GCM10011383_13650 [Hymenobacter cavernae]
MRTNDYQLLGSFFTLADAEAPEPNRLRLQVQLNAHHALFAGHFPGQPVVPGVCVLGLVKDVLQQHLAKELLLRTCSNSKFLRPIDPITMPALTLTVGYTQRDFLLDFAASIQHEHQLLCRVAGSFQSDFL